MDTEENASGEPSHENVSDYECDLDLLVEETSSDSSCVSDIGQTQTSDWHIPETEFFDYRSCTYDGPKQGVREGVTVNCRSVFEIFWFYFENTFNHVLTETNKYYNLCCKRYNTQIKEPDVTPDEFRRFLAITISMGHLRKPELVDYWSTKVALEATPAFGDVLSRNRYKHILRYLNFEDQEQKDIKSITLGKHWRIQHVFDDLNEQFQKLYAPSNRLSINEVMVAYKGKYHSKQYIPSKRKRLGIKVYKVCDSTGYTVDMHLYEGNVFGDESVTELTVLNLCRKFEGRGQLLYMDNFFTSPALFRKLYLMGILACGTARANRKGMPTDFIVQHRDSLQMAKRTVQCQVKDELTCILYYDKRYVTLLSTIHGPIRQGTCDIDEHKRHVKPRIILDYYANMGYVDKSDLMTCTYNLERRTVKWTSKLFFHLLNLTLLNAHLIHKATTKTQRRSCHLECRREIARQLIAMSATGQPSRTQRFEQVVDRLTGRHFLGDCGKRRRCTVCSAKGKERKVTTICPSCNVVLCAIPCFEKYHTEEKF